MTTIGERLKSERERLGHSQTSFGALGDKTKQTVITWESGDSFPNAAFLEVIANEGADVQYIITGKRGIPAMSVEQERAGYIVEVLSPPESAVIDALRTTGVLTPGGVVRPGELDTKAANLRSGHQPLTPAQKAPEKGKGHG